MIFGFAFTKRNISCQTLYKLQNLDNRYLLFGEASIDKYCEYLIKHNPEYILGLGIYGGRNKEYIHIETMCNNLFKKKLIDLKEYKEIEIKPFAIENELAKYSQTLGKSYCNLISWKICSLISSGKISSRYTFLHIPKNNDPDISARVISSISMDIKS